MVFNFVRKLIRRVQSKNIKDKKDVINKSITIHDYTQLMWGHNVFLDNFKGTDQNGKPYQKSFLCSGIGPLFGRRIHNCDRIAVKMASGYIGIIELWNVGYYRDPNDMWNATGKWLGYLLNSDNTPANKVR